MDFYPTVEEEDDFSQAEVAPEPEKSFIEQVKEILGLDDDEEEDPGGKKKGIFRQLFSKISGIVGIEKTEESPPEEAERAFPLSFLGATGVEEPIEKKPEASDRPEIPDTPDIAESASPAEETKEAAAPEPELIESSEEEPPVPPPVEGPTAPVPAGSHDDGVPRVRAPEAAVADAHEHDEYATHREVNRKATIAGVAGVGAAIIANSKAKSRERKVEDRSQKRDEVLNEKIKSQGRESETHQARQTRLREELAQEQLRTEQMRRQMRSAEHPAPVRTASPREERAPHTEEALQSATTQEVYSPDVHDRLPTQTSAEKRAGIEQPLPRSVELERRFEVQDDPTKVPVSYTRVNSDSRQHPQAPAARQFNRSTLVSLGTHTTAPVSPKTATQTAQTYKKAAISGAVAAVVVVLGVIAFAVLI